MKKLFLIGLLSTFCLSLIGCGSKNNEIETQNDSDTVVDEKTNKTEEFISYYDNGAIRETGTYIDGIKQGTWITYDEGGNVIDVNEYKDGKLVKNGKEDYDFASDEKLLSLYPSLSEQNRNIILGDTLQTNYVNGINNLYYDPYRGIALKLGEEFDGGLIREIDTDEGGLPHSEIIFLVKGDENEENRTGINGYREMFTIVAISKENLENFGASLDDLPFKYAPIGENNQYYFVETNVQGTYSDLIIFDVEEY